MYIDFEDSRPDTPHLERAISVREGVLISIIVHLLLLIGILFMPDLPGLETTQAARIPPQRQSEIPRFVFMQPRVDVPRPQPRVDVEASDQDRLRSTIQKPPNPQNPLPYSRGNSPERVAAEAAPPDRGNAPESAAAQGRPNDPGDVQMATNDPSRAMMRLPETPAPGPSLRLGEGGAPGKLGNALRNLQRYVEQQSQSFDNQQGSGDAQGLIQFDSKGVDFGPWLRRFVAQVKRNWFVPQAAMLLRGHVVITFNIHRDGTITDIEVKKPSSTESFNNAAVNALITSNPTMPLPAEYPSETAFFTVTFLYNEDPADVR